MSTSSRVPPPLPPPCTRMADQRSWRAMSPRLLSLVCPGLGQFVQGRLIAGAVQAVLFLAAIGAGVCVALGQLVATYRVVFAIVDDPGAELVQPDPKNLLWMVPALLAATLITAWSAWDAGKQPGVDRGA